MELSQMLKKDHEQVKQTLSKLAAAGNKGAKSRSSGLEKLVSLLVPHMKAEEKHLYPALIEAGEDDIAYRAIEEHKAAEKVLNDLQDLDVADAAWHGCCEVLQELVTHHIDEEESDAFPLIDGFDKEQQTRLLKSIQTEKQQVKSQVMAHASMG